MIQSSRLPQPPLCVVCLNSPPEKGVFVKDDATTSSQAGLVKGELVCRSLEMIVRMQDLVMTLGPVLQAFERVDYVNEFESGV